MKRTNLLALTLLLLLCAVSQGSFKFVAWADNRPYDATNEARFIWMLEQMNLIVGSEPLFHVVVGDYDYTNITEEDIANVSDIQTWYLVPGNHDPERLSWPNSVKDLPVGAPQARFIFLNEYKCQEYNYDYDKCDCSLGRVCEHTLAWLAGECSSAGGLPIFVVGHEPAFPENRHTSDSLNLYPEDRNAFWALLGEYGATYICGHTHYYSTYSSGGATQIDVGNAGNPGESNQTFVIFEVDGSSVTYTPYPIEYVSVPPEASLPWSDGFESGSFAAGGWSTSSQATVVSSAAYTGNYGALLKKTAWIEKAVSTVGYDSIYVKYARKTSKLQAGEYLYVGWYDGSDWHKLEETQNSSWSSVTRICIGAGNNPNFKIKFSTNGNAGNDEAMVDDVEITNIPSGPVNNPPTPDPLTWDSPPSATGPTSISMTATTASDPSGVEYSFACTAGGGHDSDWQDSTTYEDTVLSPGMTYTYQVKARDKSAERLETGLSTEESATTTQSGATIHVESIEMSLLPTGKNWKAVAGVVISQAQAGATVVGDWDLNGSLIQTGATGVTDGSGYTEITSPPKKAKSDETFTFVVTDVIASGYVYDPDQGVTEGSITVE